MCLSIHIGTHAGLIYRGQLFTRTVFTKRDSEGDEVAIKILQGRQMLVIAITNINVILCDTTFLVASGSYHQVW